MKKLKKILIFLLATLLPFSSTTVTAASNYDSKINTDAKTYTDFFGYSDASQNPFVNGSRYFKVSKNGEIFNIDVNGTTIQIAPSEEIGNKIVPTDISEITSQKNKNIIDSSLSLILDYINDSDVLKDKSEIIDFISEIPIKEADFDNAPSDIGDIGAIFSDEDEVIYLNRAQSESVCEWMISHEYFHAMAYFTHNNELGTYGYNTFNEVLTDMLTSSLNPSLGDNGIESGYKPLYPLLYPDINLFKDIWVKEYFYGYDEIYSKVSKDEMDLFVIILENFGEENSLELYNNIILKWYANVYTY